MGANLFPSIEFVILTSLLSNNVFPLVFLREYSSGNKEDVDLNMIND